MSDTITNPFLIAQVTILNMVTDQIKRNHADRDLYGRKHPLTAYFNTDIARAIIKNLEDAGRISITESEWSEEMLHKLREGGE